MIAAPMSPVVQPVAGVTQLEQSLRARLAADADLCADSRSLRAGDAFLAWAGRSVDARQHIADALARGAALALYEPREAPAELPLDSRLIPVIGLRDIAADLAATWYGRPSEQLDLVAVTGTNGKTSCTQWIAEGWAAAGRTSAVIGTLGSGVVGEPLSPFGLTMPDAVSLQRMLDGFVRRGVEAVAMEASSIGIDQGRLDAARCRLAMLTNITRDHLDYHGSEAAYREAKLKLFERPGLSGVVVNADDPVCAQILGRAPSSYERVVYGEQAAAIAGTVARRLVVQAVHENRQGMELALSGDFGRGRIRLNLLGRFNAINAAGVAACWLTMGMSFDEACARLSSLKPVAGRLERLERDGQPLVVVDYAHTPDALKQVLSALRSVAQHREGRLWCVFGAGGDRDVGKRPLMGEVVSAGSDRFIITSDNPRSEAPSAIAAEIRAGCVRAADAIELDRGRAIAQAIASADASDVVLIAGKGHECWQEIAGERLAFSDREVAVQALRQRAETAHV